MNGVCDLRVSRETAECRPAYSNLSSIRERWAVQMIACTATATKCQERDIAEYLGMTSFKTIRMSCVKPRHRLMVAAKGNNRTAAELSLVRALRLSSSRAAVVFCSLRRESDKVAKLLARNGVKSEAYYAGVEDRAGVLERFREGVHRGTRNATPCAIPHESTAGYKKFHVYTHV